MAKAKHEPDLQPLLRRVPDLQALEFSYWSSADDSYDEAVHEEAAQQLQEVILAHHLTSLCVTHVDLTERMGLSFVPASDGGKLSELRQAFHVHSRKMATRSRAMG